MRGKGIKTGNPSGELGSECICIDKHAGSVLQFALGSAAPSIIRFLMESDPFRTPYIYSVCIEYGARSTKYMSQEGIFGMVPSDVVVVHGSTLNWYGVQSTELLLFIP